MTKSQSNGQRKWGNKRFVTVRDLDSGSKEEKDISKVSKRIGLSTNMSLNIKTYRSTGILSFSKEFVLYFT